MQMMHPVGAVCSYASGGAFRTLSSGLNPKGTASHKAVLCPLGGGAIALAYMSRSLKPPVSTHGWRYLGCVRIIC